MITTCNRIEVGEIVRRPNEVFYSVYDILLAAVYEIGQETYYAVLKDYNGWHLNLVEDDQL